MKAPYTRAHARTHARAHADTSRDGVEHGMSEYVDGRFGGDKAKSVTGSVRVPILEVTGSLPVPILRAYAASRRGPAAAAENFGVSE